MTVQNVGDAPETALGRAARTLMGGGCIVYPTETFYALGASVGSAKALERVNAIKGRPRSKPLPVIIGDMDQLAQVLDEDAERWPGLDLARELMDRFWPGSLSIIVPARKDLPPQLLDARGCVSVRLTPHPQARQLCLAVGTPLAATSANVSGDPAVNDLGDLSPAVCLGADYVLAGDPSPAGGQASTVLRPLKGREAVMYRAGAVPVETLVQAGVRLVEEA
ncbi:L-threonylcarbamoyladenylate synthase [Fundidesulfovibrio terrae]|uniref:L-threonylcarbamoyladenylate synthase n=1 Tax=Fundidesulfovibrio terrae TaxID=2922866 RepID=UPI001FAFEF4F|nr:L-threonylcarbamoyladenylate synthase [Fundidesulfovibrio terrae]